MSKPFATNEFLLGVDRWVESTTDPVSGGGQAGAVGSLWQMGGTFPTTPAVLIEKLNTDPVSGWCRENLANIVIKNAVRDYGCVGDGATDNRAKIQTACNDIDALGGGILYFPPAAVSYRVTKNTGAGGVAGRSSMYLQNLHNILIMGDGPQSLLAMIGDSGFGDWYMWTLGDGTSRITFYNLGFDGTGVLNPDPAHQTHFIQNQGIAGETHGGAHDIDVVGCYFGQIVGDCVRNIAENTEDLEDIRIHHNFFDMGGVARSCTEAQRYSRRIQFCYNWGFGGSDQLVDFEPTGGSGLGTAGPEEWLILGNHLDGTTGSITVTVAGESGTDPSRRNILAYNTILGDGVEGPNVSTIDIIGNVIISNKVSSNAVLSFIRVMTQMTIIANIAEAVGVAASSKIVFAFEENLGSDPFEILVYGNIGRTATTAVGGTSVANCTGGQRFAFNDNILVCDSTTANASFGVSLSSTTTIQLDMAMASGNLILGTTQKLRAGLNFHASVSSSRNCAANYNFVDNADSAVLFDRGAAETQLDWRNANSNNIVNALTAIIEMSTNVGVTMEGPAGPGSQISFIHLAAGPPGSTAAPAGSMSLNDLGGSATAVWYKETGVGVSGGTAGWFGVGGSDILFSVVDTTTTLTALFMAPGMGLVTASGPEIKLAIPRAGNIRSFRVRQVAGTGTGNTVYTLRLNGVDRIGLTVATTSLGGTFTLSITCAVGDLISVKITKTGVPTLGPQDAVTTCELV